MSKQIMNKVFSCAGDCASKIHSQDTGSIHLNSDDVGTAVKRYKEDYGSELVCEELGGFHIDFSMDKANSETYAIENSFLVKKTYIDIFLEPTDKDCKTINSEHIRMKCIPASCIKYYTEQHNIFVLDMYTQLFNNKTIKSDSTNDGNKFICRSNKDHTIPNVSDFNRKCQYIRESDKFFITWT